MESTKKKEEKLNINKTIQKAAQQAAERTIQQLKSNNMLKNNLNYYKKVEILLYNYENLKDALLQKDEDIEYIEKYGLPQSSKSIVVYQTTNGGISAEDRYLYLREKYRIEKMETEREVRRIDNALNKVRQDKYFDIIQLKFLNQEEEKLDTDEKIAERLNKDQSTITRNRKRLMNKLITILFPENIKHFA